METLLDPISKYALIAQKGKGLRKQVLKNWEYHFSSTKISLKQRGGNSTSRLLLKPEVQKHQC